jgi:hypothetical protein
MVKLSSDSPLVFGAPLNKACSPGSYIPDILEQAFKYIEEKGRHLFIHLSC